MIPRQPLIEFRDVSVTRGNTSILRNCSFSLFSGESTVLTGPSGAGKSSVLQVLLGFLPLTGGTVFFEGQQLSIPVVLRLRRTTATVLQEPVANGPTVRDALLLPFTFKCNRHAPPNEQSIETILTSLGLSAAILEHPVTEISGGEKQRITLARGLLLHRELLFLDEITSALDDASKRNVFTVVQQQHGTILSVAHDPAWIAQCDRVIRLADGRVVDIVQQQPAGSHHDND